MQYDPEIFDIQARIKETISLLRRAGRSYSSARQKMSAAKIDAEVGYATAFSETDTSARVGDREAEAVKNNAPKQRDYVMLEAEVDALKQTLMVLSNTLNGLQTQAKLITTQLRINDYD
jgi:hypothetical protein